MTEKQVRSILPAARDVFAGVTQAVGAFVPGVGGLGKGISLIVKAMEDLTLAEEMLPEARQSGFEFVKLYEGFIRKPGFVPSNRLVD
jgi:hypothetical protein